MKRLDQLISNLNPEQREAVLQTEGPVLILAGAGSGKTRVITTRIAYLIHSRRAAPGEILGVTFTNKAAQEMRERVAGLVGKKAATGIVLSTFHSFCVRVLRAEIEHVGYGRNFTISTESDARTLVRRSLDDLDSIRDAFDPGIFLSRIGMLKSAGLDPAGGIEPPEPTKSKNSEPPREETDAMGRYSKWLPEVYERYQSALRAANTVDFDDLLLLTLRLFRGNPRILARYRKQFRYVMVDEYQDTNKVQYDLLMQLAGKHRNLCVVGDDDQSIYSWRGADVRNILSFEEDFPDAKVVKLEQNYRSTQTILNAANSVIANNAERRVKKLWSDLGAGRRIDRFLVANEEEEAKEAARWLRHIRERTKAKYADFAVLYRSNQQSRAFEITLRQAGIPYTVVGGQEFFDRAEVKDILAYLRVIVNPGDAASFLRIVNVPRRGIGHTTLHRANEICRTEGVSPGKALASLLKSGGLPANTQTGIDRFLGLLTEFRKRFRACGGRLLETTHDLVDAIDYRGELFRTCKSSAQFEARWANVEALLTAVADLQEQSKGRVPTLTAFLDESALASDEDRASKAERRENAVTLMTVHSAKGLEFPFVFVVGVEEGLFPHEKSMREGGIEEERRLFYVAVTRAKRHLTLFEAARRERRGKRRMSVPSRFLSEVPAELTNENIRAARDMVEASVDAPAPPSKAKRRRKSRAR